MFALSVETLSPSLQPSQHAKTAGDVSRNPEHSLRSSLKQETGPEVAKLDLMAPKHLGLPQQNSKRLASNPTRPLPTSYVKGGATPTPPTPIRATVCFGMLHKQKTFLVCWTIYKISRKEKWQSFRFSTFKTTQRTCCLNKENKSFTTT